MTGLHLPVQIVTCLPTAAVDVRPWTSAGGAAAVVSTAGQDRAVDVASSRRILRGRASSGGPEGLWSARFREVDGGSRRAAEDHTVTHFFARLLFRIASHNRTSWWPSSAVAKSTGVPRPLAMCS